MVRLVNLVFKCSLFWTQINLEMPDNEGVICCKILAIGHSEDMLRDNGIGYLKTGQIVTLVRAVDLTSTAINGNIFIALLSEL